MFRLHKIQYRKMSGMVLLTFLFGLSSGGCGGQGVTFVAGGNVQSAQQRDMPEEDISPEEESARTGAESSTAETGGLTPGENVDAERGAFAEPQDEAGGTSGFGVTSRSELSEADEDLPAGHVLSGEMDYSSYAGVVEASEIYVDIEGAVCRPGVYRLQSGDRVYQAVEAAGGFTEDAVPHVLNQALTLSDGIQIYIPTAAEVRAAEEANMRAAPAVPVPDHVTDSAAGPEAGFAQGNTSAGIQDGGFIQENAAAGTQDAGFGLVNINTADAAHLETLNGIGPARAQAIIEYRQTVSAFNTIEDIKKVSGIGNGIFSRIRDHITV